MTTKKIERRIKIKYRIRKRVNGTAERPRMTVFRSNKQIYVQIVDDSWYNTEKPFTRTVRKKGRNVEVKYCPKGKTIVSASSIGMETMPKAEQAEKVGALIAEKAIAAGITTVVFDRNGYLYHGRVKQLADAARKGGLNF
ncbi:MAG: 50S ribosomal protein L18 [Prevotella sp.]|jgi:large subunit ribosomal protein L18|nr:50S ribosomal protein L18 [Prevotella sp.]MBR3089438.1 50S ribosomal protein L18 [Prevotella sp.]